MVTAKKKSSAPELKKSIATGAKEAKHFNLLLAQFVIGANLPFRIVEGKTFRNFIKSIRPSYLKYLPSRNTLASTLLNQLYTRCLELEKKKVDKQSCLLVDSWTNGPAKQKHFACMTHNAGRQSQFVDSYDMTTTSENSENLEDSVCDAKELCKTKYETDCYCLISDNAANMLKLGGLIGHHMWFNNCNSHVGNLLAKDVVNLDLKQQVDKITTCFRRPHLLKLIEEHGGKRCKVPSDVRWCYYRDAYQNLIDNWEIFQIIANNNPERVETDVKNLLKNNAFINKIRKEVEIQSPICEIINQCQKKDTNLSDAVSLWLDLNPPQGICRSLKKKYSERKKMALTKIALSAYYLDPNSDKTRLSSSHLSEIRTFVSSQLRITSNPKAVDQLIDYMAQKDMYTKYTRKKISSLDYWELMKDDAPELAAVAIKLLKIPASTAQLERIFSMWKYVHSKLRNRLSFEKSKKLIHIYYFLITNDESLMNIDWMDGDIEL